MTAGRDELEASWQEQLIRLKMPPIQADGNGDEIIELFDRMDNLSHQCSGYHDSLMPCFDDEPLWWRVLQWLKTMFLKMAQSYHGKPMLLLVFPLLVGICVGYILGRQSHKQQPTTRNAVATFKNWVSLLVVYLGGFAADQTTLKQGQPRRSEPQPGTEKESTSKLSNTNSFASKSLPIVSESREKLVRANLRSEAGTRSESGVAVGQVPRHVAVIMDGNRRYGRQKYGNASQGHWDGSSKLVEFAKWCIAEHVSVLTVYAFSTENWNRDPAEVSALMAIFSKYVDELRVEALKRNIKILVLSTDIARVRPNGILAPPTQIPTHVKHGLRRMVEETAHCNGLTMNICMSYGSRGEIVAASKSLATDVANGNLDVSKIDEELFESHLLTCQSGDPDVLIRTSGEIRISNFLLWQLAYTEMFFVDKPWPAVEKEDLLKVIRSYASSRIRRFGK
eukprot:scaffold1706_cov116-Cylindrotheca_fusiformis.AAC.21